MSKRFEFIREVRKALPPRSVGKRGKDGIHESARPGYPPTCVIRTDTYASHFDYFIELVKAARVDFPDLKDDEIEILHFGGRHYKGTFGISFKADSDESVPGTYREIPEVEFLL